MFYFIIGTIVFLVLYIVSKIFSNKAQDGLTIKDKMLLIQELTNLNKYSISVLIASSVIYFAVMRHLKFPYDTMILIFCVIATIYIVVFAYFIYREVKNIAKSSKLAFYYTVSKTLLLITLSIFITSLFLYFSKYCITLN